MRINIQHISLEGLILEEENSAASLDLETDIVKFHGPVKIKAVISKITNVVMVDMVLSSVLYMSCSRCLNNFDVDFYKNFQLNYQINKTEQFIDLNPDIRDQIILDYPIKPLCGISCKGLCLKCGGNLNEGNCNCSKVC